MPLPPPRLAPVTSATRSLRRGLVTAASGRKSLRSRTTSVALAGVRECPPDWRFLFSVRYPRPVRSIAAFLDVGYGSTRKRIANPPTRNLLGLSGLGDRSLALRVGERSRQLDRVVGIH